MNKLGYQPMPVLMRAEPGHARQTSNSAKILLTAAKLGGILALCGAALLCLVTFNAFPPRAIESEAASSLPVTQAYPAVSAGHENELAAPQADVNQGLQDTIATDRAILDQPPVKAQSPSSTAAPISQVSTSEDANKLLKEGYTESARTVSETPPISEVARKKLERKRVRAEQHRAELEDSYENHAISHETYKNGQVKYQSAIEKYRSKMEFGKGSNKEATGQN